MEQTAPITPNTATPSFIQALFDQLHARQRELGLTDKTLMQITDISKTSGCPLARVMRKELRERGIRHLKVVFSPEQPAPTDQLEAPPPGRRSVPASVAWVPSCAGLMMAGAVIQDLIQEGRETL